jgi:hypothetical protein
MRHYPLLYLDLWIKSICYHITVMNVNCNCQSPGSCGHAVCQTDVGFTMIWYLLLMLCVGIYWNWFELDWRGQLLVCVAVVFQLGLRGSQQLLLYIVSTPNHFYMTIRQLG